MLLNCTAFIIIVSCYMKMYCSIRGSHRWNSNDTRIAKRMAILVFTDFACWAPISFFSITAAFGLDMLSLNDAKVFTIFVLPLNSCANPFLYAIFTKQFKKDCSLICKRLENCTMKKHISKINKKNYSLTWGSSRHPSALNSFFNTHDMRMRRINMPHHSRNIVYLSRPDIKDKFTSDDKSNILLCSACCEDYGDQNMSVSRTNTGVNESDMSWESNSSCTCPCHVEVKEQKVMEQGKGLFLKLMQKRQRKYKYNLDSVSGEGDVDSDPNLNLFVLSNTEEKQCDSTMITSPKYTFTSRERSRSMNCRSGLSGDVCQSPGGGAYEFSGSLSAPDASNTDSAEHNIFDILDAAQPSCPKNSTHDNINLTDGMISELRHMCIPSSYRVHSHASRHHRHTHQRQTKTESIKKEIDPPEERGARMPPSQTRADPEGCESIEGNSLKVSSQLGGSMTCLFSTPEHQARRQQYLLSDPNHISMSKAHPDKIPPSPPQSPSSHYDAQIDEDDTADTDSAFHPLLSTKRQSRSVDFENCENADDVDASVSFLERFPRSPSLQNFAHASRSFIFSKNKSRSDQL